MQSSVIYRFTAERQKNESYYISVIRVEGTLAKSVPLKSHLTLPVTSKNTMPSEEDNQLVPRTQALDTRDLPVSTGNLSSNKEENSKSHIEDNVVPPIGITLKFQGISGESVDILKTSDSTLPVTNKVTNKVASTKLHTATMKDMLSGGLPIEINATTRDPLPEPGKDNILLGELHIVSLPAGPSSAAQISELTVNQTFQIYYERPNVLWPIDTDCDVQADDAAMILRAFMLAKIATSRMDARAILAAQTEGLEKQKAAAKADGLKFNAQHLLKIWRDFEEEDEKHHVSACKESSEEHVHSTNGKRKLLLLENWLARKAECLHDTVHDDKGWLYVIVCLMLGLTLGWVWLPGLTYWSLLGWLLTVLSVVGGAVFLLYALNLKLLSNRILEKLHENSTEKLNHTMAELVQTNTNVAAMNLATLPKNTYVSELLLCQMDQALHLKERLTSIEGVIKARATYLSGNVQHIEQHRDRVRRSITAAGSGVFVGFFTYEVGESVMSYMHVTHHQDQNSMLYWLFANGERIKVQQGHAAALPAPVEAHEEHAAQAGDSHAAPKVVESGHKEAVVASHTVQHGPAIDPEFIQAYHDPEVFAHSVLLTLTIVFSVITAWIAIRKPEAEQSGGHGHH